MSDQNKDNNQNTQVSSKKLKTTVVKDVISKSRTMTGSKPDQITINPIQEEKEKTAVMAFGRYNPPTVGHEKLIHKVESVASEHKGDAHIIASHSEGNGKNPLPKEKKVGYLKKVVKPTTSVSSSDKEHPSFLHQAKKLHDAGYHHLVMVAGSDRVDDYHKKLHQYNGKEGHYNFKSIKVVSAGHRDPDAEGTEGMSGTKMREHARSGNMKAFKSGLPKALHSHAEEIADHIKSIKEDLDDLFDELFTEEEQLDEITLQQRMKRAMIMRRYQSRIELARKRSMLRRANTKVITNRARKLAIKKMKSKLAGGRDPESLSAAEKQRIENIVSKRKAAIRRLAMRLVPQVRKKESRRFTKEDLDISNLLESYEFLNAIYDVVIEDIDRSNTHKREWGTSSLTKIYKNDTPGEKEIEEAKKEIAVEDDVTLAVNAVKNRYNPDFFKRMREKDALDKEIEMAAKENVKEDLDNVFDEQFGKNREAVPRSGQERKDIDLVVRKGEDRKTDDRPYRHQAIKKQIIDEQPEASFGKGPPSNMSSPSNDTAKQALKLPKATIPDFKSKIPLKLPNVNDYTPDMFKSEAYGKGYKSPWEKIEKARPGIGKKIDTAAAALKQNAADYQAIIDKENKKKEVKEDLRQWFKDKWVRMDTKGNIKGDCAREPGEGKPKCLPIAKARAMDKDDRALAARRKRREDPVADRPGKGGAPINVRTEEVEMTPSGQVTFGSYTTKHFDICPSAVKLYTGIENKTQMSHLAVENMMLHDLLFRLEKQVVAIGHSDKDDIEKAEHIADLIMTNAKRMGLEKEHSYIEDPHLKTIRDLNKTQSEAANPAQQAAIAIALIKAGKKKGKNPGPQKEENNIKETKSAPKGFHFTRSGKLKKGDADLDGSGGKMLRSDPLDKLRSKIPPVSEEIINEKNKPTNPELWSRAKALAKSKFDVYPSAYANGWAAKWYKSKGGGWS